MILECYRKLKEVAEKEYSDIIRESNIIYSYTGRARKLRFELLDNTFIDIWHSLEGEYSFHWEQRNLRNTLYRHDNAPHKKWEYVKTFPKHCHDGSQDNVIESHLSNVPEKAVSEFLDIVRRKLIEMKKERQIFNIHYITGKSIGWLERKSFVKGRPRQLHSFYY